MKLRLPNTSFRVTFESASGVLTEHVVQFQVFGVPEDDQSASFTALDESAFIADDATLGGLNLSGFAQPALNAQFEPTEILIV